MKASTQEKHLVLVIHLASGMFHWLLFVRCQFAVWVQGGLGTEKTSGFLSWKDNGMHLSKLLLGKRCIMKHHSFLGLQRSADALQRPLLIPPAQKSVPNNIQDIQTHCNGEKIFPFSCLANEDILIPETVLISLQMDLRLFVTISKLCFKKKKDKERPKNTNIS